MPSIQSIAIAPDTVTIVTWRGTFTLTRAQIPANVINKPIATIEAFANTWLATNLPGMQAVVHIFAVTPILVFTMLCADTGVNIPVNWWLGV